ncbi:MAG: GNAT family N-acetyltransferase [Gaiellaceae bacterium MAG52_C11]|nr:GNAT family N-acetyltransferase [Candidatus Gaiellasilicea maunaloa]
MSPPPLSPILAGEPGRARPIRFETISERDGLAARADEWDALVSTTSRQSPFFSTPWLLAWWRHHGQERAMRIEIALDGDRLVGGLPLEVERTRMGSRVAHFMGRHHAPLADVLVADDCDELAIGRALVERAGTGGTDFGDFFGVAHDSVLARVAGSDATLVERIEAPFIDLARGWDEIYGERTSSKRRNLHRRRRRQLGELGELSIEIARDEDDLAAALDAAFRLHELRWEGRSDGSEFTTAVGKAFHREAVRALGARDMARILTMRLDGVPIAFHYWIQYAGCMYVHRLAFDPAFAKHSPGLIATLDAIESAEQEGAGRVEFLGGGERYKLELADATAPLYQCIGFATTLRGRAGVSAARAAIAVHMRLRRSERARSLYLRAGRFQRRPESDSNSVL